MIKKLKVNDIYKKCELKEKFETTLDLEELECDLVGQNRAKSALNYGLSIDKYGYNIFLSGIHSSRKKKYLESVLNKVAKTKYFSHRVISGTSLSAKEPNSFKNFSKAFHFL